MLLLGPDGDWGLSWCGGAAFDGHGLGLGQRLGDSWGTAAACASSMSLLPHLLWYVRV